MKRRDIAILIVMIVVFPQVAFATDQGLDNPVHKFWICAINSYSSLEEGKYQEHTCRANTQYSGIM